MSPRTLCYLGTYTNTDSQGIYLYEQDPASGELGFLNVSAAGQHPSYLAFHPDGRHLYAVNETLEWDGRPSGGVSAYTIEPATGALTLINRQASGGGNPCYVSVDATGQTLLVANHRDASVAALPIAPDGALGPIRDFHPYAPSAEEAARNKVAHGHCIVIDPTNQYAIACDAGLDRLMLYRLDPGASRLIPHDPPYLQLPEGAAPRHFVIHPSRRWAYAIGEASSTMFALAWDETRGILAVQQAIKALPPDFSGRNMCADVHVHPNGRLLYGSNRGQDAIVGYAIDPATGQLTLLGHTSTQGHWPRNFALDPAGTFLYVANQRSDSVVCYRVDGATGALEPTGFVLQVPIPVCLKFRVV